MSYPTITAILNTHNATVVTCIGRALDSILAQQISEPWEVIVVNDGPADERVRAIVEPYEALFDAKGIPFTFMGTEQESGYQCQPKNIAIQHSHGEYIAFLDYDNEWSPDHLQVLYDAITEGSVWPDLTYGRRTYKRDEGCPEEVELPNTNGMKMRIEERDSPLVEWVDENVKLMVNHALANFVDTSDFMCSKGAYWRLFMSTGKMWNEELRRFGDWELVARGAVYAGWRGKAVDKVITTYHITGRNVQLTRPVNEVPVSRAV